MNAMVNKIPGKPLIKGPLPKGKKIPIDRTCFQHLVPFAPALPQRRKQVGNPAVAPGKQSLKIGPSGRIGMQVNIGQCF
jgi:hypothetical protein